MKKMKKAVTDSSPPLYAVAGEDTKMRIRHQILNQDFEELQKETEATKERLQRATQKKLTLLAEVRFLRRRYKFLVNNPTQKTQTEHVVQQNPRVRGEGALKEKNLKAKEAAVRGLPVGLDLNQISIPEGEEPGEFQAAWEPMRVEKKLKRPSMERDTLGNDLKQSICRDVGNGSNRTGKRKISWQDQVALRV